MNLAEYTETLSPQLTAIVEERMRQDDKWGQQNHEPGKWMLILMEEVGEFSQAVLDRAFGGDDPDNVRTELVQFIAVGLSMLECCDRNGWHHPLPKETS